jgi:hypothetical protein
VGVRIFEERVRAALAPLIAVQQLVSLVAEDAQPRFLAFLCAGSARRTFFPGPDLWAHLRLPLESSARSIDRLYRKFDISLCVVTNQFKAFQRFPHTQRCKTGWVTDRNTVGSLTE